MTTASEQNKGRGRRRDRGTPPQGEPPAPPVNAPLARTNPGPAEPKPVAKKRRPAMMALALMLIALSALGGVWLVNRGAQTVSVLRVTTPVQRGEVIEASDLAVVEFPADTVGFATVPGSSINSVPGQVAQYELRADTLLAPDAFGTELPVESGRAIVSVAVTPDRLPSTPMRAGDPVTIVEIPGGGSQDLTNLVPTEWQATYVSQQAIGASGQVLLNLEVDVDDAPDITARNGVDRLGVYVLGGSTAAAEPAATTTDEGGAGDAATTEPTETPTPAPTTEAPADGQDG